VWKSERRTIDRPKISEHALNTSKNETQITSTKALTSIHKKLFEAGMLTKCSAD